MKANATDAEARELKRAYLQDFFFYIYINKEKLQYKLQYLQNKHYNTTRLVGRLETITLTLKTIIVTLISSVIYCMF